MTVKVWPATVSVPVRDDVAVLAVALKATVPLPLALAPEVMVNHVALLAAVQAQALVVVTLTDPVDAVSATDVLVGEMV